MEFKRTVSAIVLFQVLIQMVRPSLLCPHDCSCIAREQTLVTACINLDLQSIPSDIPLETGELYLKGNHFPTLQQGSFANLTWLRTIVMTDCGIETVEPNAFSGLRSLTHLDLRWNDIQELEPYTFSGLFNLRRLILDHNSISVINNFAFHGLNLTKLSLDRNEKLSEIAHKAFHGSRVQNLLMNNVSLSSTSANALVPLASSLRELTWMNNQRKLTIPAELFHEFRFSNLNLNHNGITDSSFLKNTNTDDLSLEGNPIGSMDFSQFHNLKEVRNLRLQNTNFSSIKSSYFKGMSHLQQLYISNNGIKQLSSELRDVFSKLERLVIDGNPLHCNCEMLWFQDLIRTSEVTIIGARCSTPETDDVLLKPRESFVCHPPEIVKFTRAINSTNNVHILTLNCTAKGDPAPDITWLSPDGSELSSSEPRDEELFVHSDSIIMGTVDTMDHGLYTCIAINDAGNDTSTKTVDVDSYDIIGSHKLNSACTLYHLCISLLIFICCNVCVNIV